MSDEPKAGRAIHSEEWRQVDGWPRYSVSNLGRLKSGDRMIRGCSHAGYIRVHLHDRGRIRRTHMHVLVAEAFIGPRPDGMLVCHGDGDGLNNHLSNLRYGTFADNHADSKRHGTAAVGERQGNAKLTGARVAEMRSMRKSCGMSFRDLGRAFGVSPSVARGAVRGVSWKEADGPVEPIQRTKATLTERDVREMRRLYERGLSQDRIGEIFGVGRSAAGSVVRGETWKGVAR